ncbi:conserved hypothetical protein [Talaromyces stipitatus ATCC 10500]|uniref:Integrase catalytic domain-containing protein n=1 Tax=Talaromyces stipitatus (strain ATCC 10500 / CBS 375.48 / QM 6759 / NRRL 1006) TaxID=441959 RepID=B8MCQ1_TALSN|nr:uncharacterized protein TSTA_126610 [Talaromyces stipitatus ATCC 10500]EED18953.1 conserved hypothetical protein [Talaromyces stipitatus ATCC 10500]
MEGITETAEPNHEALFQMTLNDPPFKTNFTEFRKINSIKMISMLNDYSTYHAFTRDDKYQPLISYADKATDQDNEAFTLDQYSSNEFHGIIPDSGAASISSAGELQVLALQKTDPSIRIDTSAGRENHIKFGKDIAIVKGIVRVPTPIGTITFHVVPTNTPFLLCLKDMNDLGGSNIVPIVRKWGHPWMLLNRLESVAYHLTELELCQLHRRFGHPLVQRLATVLERANHDFDADILKKLTKFCHQCQMHEKSPGRFKFTLKDDHEFNYSVIIDIMYIEGKPVLHVVDSGTAFNAARFLKDMTASIAWNTLRLCWIDCYLGPPDQIVHDAGTNFASDEFRQYAKSMAIHIREVLVEAHNAVGKVERYHAPLRRAYEIIQEELKGENVLKEAILQMAVKTLNDTAGPDGLVPTLLVFGAYPRLTEWDAPSPSVAKRAKAIECATKEVRKLKAARQVQDALSMCNGPNTKAMLDLPLQSDVWVWREAKGWTGPFKLLAITGETCTVAMPRGPANFRTTVVKPYLSKPVPEASETPEGDHECSQTPREEIEAPI